MSRREMVKKLLKIYSVNNGYVSVSSGDTDGQSVLKKPYTFVSVSIYLDPVVITTGYGFAKVMHPDRWDTQRGLSIALGKACGDLADEIIAAGLRDRFSDWTPVERV